MSLSTVLKTIGKDLSHVGGWIDDGLKVAIKITGAIDPPLGAIFTTVDEVLEKVLGITGSTAPTITADQLQAITQAVTLLEILKILPTPTPAPATPAAPSA